MTPSTDLDAGLLVGAQDVVPWPQEPPLPAPFVEIKDPARFGGERGIAREDPATMRVSPRTAVA
jgi:hypothetical protein